MKVRLQKNRCVLAERIVEGVTVIGLEAYCRLL
jgi:hypothetical protein